MRALTYHDPRDIRYEDVPDPTPTDRDGAVVQVHLCGICGSDLHIYGGEGFSPDIGYCVGHEAVGEVVEVGSAVSTFKVGDRVLVPASVGCGTCAMCARGLVARCEREEFNCYGLSHALPGSQAEAVAVPYADGNLIAVPEGVSDEAAVVLTDNAATAWYGARRAQVAPGDTVAVIGLGPVGLMAVAAAQLMGAAHVLGIDLIAGRREAAQLLGADPIDDVDVRADVLERTGGKGVDVVIEAAGPDSTIGLAFDLVRRAGRVSVVGVNQNMKFSFPMALAQWKELEFHIGLCSVQHELPALLALTAAGRLQPETVVSHRLRLSDGPEAYRLYDSREGGVSKVVMDPRV